VSCSLSRRNTLPNSYVAATRDPRNLPNYGRGTPDDCLERNLHSRFPKVGISPFVVLQLVLFGVPAITMRAVHRVIRPVFRELTKQESAMVLPPRSPQLLARHPKLLDVRSRQQVRELLDRYEALRTVIEFRDRLHQI
jgi:hypothetical protein